MKTPSRKMPSAPVRGTSWFAWPLLVVLAGGLVYWIYSKPYALLCIFALVLFVWIQACSEKRQMRRQARSRNGESICEFSRSFKRGTDTWILRAVYEEISKFRAIEGLPMPIRAEDNYKGDLKIDSEDLDDLGFAIAARSGRSMTDAEHNPLYGKVRTIRDLVYFLENQPRISNAV